METKEQNTLLLQSHDPKKLKDTAQTIIRFAADLKVWVFNGVMGAGKTTLIKAICEEFGVIDQTSSPTFSIVNEYQNQAGEIFYHFDFYRVESICEAIDIGTTEYFYSGDYCFIEWAERIAELIPEQYLELRIEETDPNERTILLIKHG